MFSLVEHNKLLNFTGDKFTKFSFLEVKFPMKPPMPINNNNSVINGVNKFIPQPDSKVICKNKIVNQNFNIK